MEDLHEAAASPLERFVRAYAETVGGVWDEIEPQVYDLLVPTRETGGGVVRVTFDPDALPDHPGSQLASLGTPFIDGLLADAQARGRRARFYLMGLNPAPHDLVGRLRRALQLAPPLELRLERARTLSFPQAVFWFQAEFVSDQKEQTVVPVAMDLHFGRVMRQREVLLERSRLAPHAPVAFAEVRHSGVARAFPEARAEALRTIATLGNVRDRELRERCERQVARMERYYADLRAELEAQAQRGRAAADADNRLAERLAAVQREEQTRVAELRQKSALRVSVRLLQLAVIEQPKTLVQAALAAPGHPAVPVEIVWDPLMETVEAVPCPGCSRPSYAFDMTRQGKVVCPNCAGPGSARASR